jgi:proline dehydrogenase
MLRSLLIYLSKAGWAQKIVMEWGFSRRAAQRFIAGETVSQAIQSIKALNAKNIAATLDHLGEHTTTVAEADRAADEIIAVLDELQKQGVRANLSLKLTQLGLGLDDEACRANLQRILARARAHGNFVRIDMEDSPYTGRTIQIYGDLIAAGYGPETVGLVIQSYLYRSEGDVRSLAAAGTRIRLVKGAYQESTEVAFPRKADVDASYDRLAALLIDASLSHRSRLSPDGRIPPLAAMATHDERRIAFARAYAAQAGLPKDGLEFQMLYGIRRDLQEALVREGYLVRVYVPFGTHWYPYFMRRLAERPANLWFILSNLFKR